MTILTLRRSHPPFWLGVGAAMGAWLVAWVLMAPAVDWLMAVLGVATSDGLGASVAFFLFDLPKVLLLLVGVVTLVSFLRSLDLRVA
jgi:hypothetical protein